MAGTSRWIPLRQVFPWRAGAENPEDAVKDIARFNRRSPLSSRPTARRRKIRGNPFPLFVCNIHNAIETKALPWRQLKNKVLGIASHYFRISSSVVNPKLLVTIVILYGEHLLFHPFFWETRHGDERLAGIIIVSFPFHLCVTGIPISYVFALIFGIFPLVTLRSL